MFTGIVEEVGKVVSFRPEAEAGELSIAGERARIDATLGDSIAVNGCCLTLARLSENALHFDVLEETRRLTNFGALAAGSPVNLERSLRFGGKVGGHFVTGHVDGMGKIVRWEKSGADHVLEIAAPANVMRYVIRKGSIAIDGISLTVAGVKKKTFRVWIIPHTFTATALRERQVGDAVNLEADLLGKYVERFLAGRR